MLANPIPTAKAAAPTFIPIPPGVEAKADCAPLTVSIPAWIIAAAFDAAESCSAKLDTKLKTPSAINCSPLAWSSLSFLSLADLSFLPLLCQFLLS